MDVGGRDKMCSEEEREAERRLDMITSCLMELSTDLDNLLLLGSEVGELERNIDKFL